MVIFKDYKRKVASINAIPMKSLEPIKDWLNSMGIKYTEGPMNLNWCAVVALRICRLYVVLFVFAGPKS